jgi:GAF domain-containing protein
LGNTIVHDPVASRLTCDDEDLVELLGQQLQLAGQAQQHKRKLATLAQQEARAN